MVAGRGDGTELGAEIIKRVSGTQEEAPRSEAALTELGAREVEEVLQRGVHGLPV